MRKPESSSLTDIQRRIADLEAQRTAIRAAAAGRPFTAAEREQITLLTTALGAAWELRRLELAQRPQRDHELIIVYQLKERTV
jgi:GAF domain-containing protein